MARQNIQRKFTYRGLVVQIKKDLAQPGGFWGYSIEYRDGGLIDSKWNFSDYNMCLETAKDQARQESLFFKSQDEQLQLMMDKII